MTAVSRIATLITVAAIALLAYHEYTKPEVIDISDIRPLDESMEIAKAEKVLVKLDQNEFNCMRTNMYFEARNQKTDMAMVAVGYTVLNRMKSKQYPNTVCGVVYQHHQFSWTYLLKNHHPNLNNIIERKAWNRATQMAAAVMRKEVANPIGSATMYHASYVNPYWKHAYRKVATIETHIFYSPIKV